MKMNGGNGREETEEGMTDGDSVHIVPRATLCVASEQHEPSAIEARLCWIRLTMKTDRLLQSK